MEQILVLMGSGESSYSTFLDCTEDTFYNNSCQRSEIGLCRYVMYKRKLVAFFYDDMEAAARAFELGAQYPIGANGRLSHITLSVVLDGLIAFYFARMHRQDESRWQNIGEAVIDLARQWEKSSSWNFSNKVRSTNKLILPLCRTN